MLRTHTRPSRDLRNNYRDIVELVKQQDQVIITNNGVGEVALVNLDVYAQFEEFLHRGFVYEELQKTKGKLNDPSVVMYDADNVHDELDQILEAHGL